MFNVILKLKKGLLPFLLIFVLTSCGGYYKHVMFKSDSSLEALQKPLQDLHNSYILKPSDRFSVQLYTNKGELVLDPNQSFSKSMNVQQIGQGQGPVVMYDVMPNGHALLPVIGSIKVSGYNVAQLDSILNIKYSAVYNDAFVVTQVVNNRVTVLGGSSGGIVIPLTSDNMNILEVIALAGGIQKFNRADNIRLIRGDLKNPSIQIIDLSTIEGMMAANLHVQPNDIIYIEPVRRVLPETLAEVGPILGVTTSIITLLFLISNN